MLIGVAFLAERPSALARSGIPTAVPAVASSRPWRVPRRLVPPVVGTGALATTALLLYRLATRQQLLAIAVVLFSLYPVVPVVLGVALLRERVSRTQLVGVVAAAAAVALISLG